MNRRRLIFLTGGALLAPKLAWAQAKRVVKIATLDDAVEGIRASAWAAFRRRLGELVQGELAWESRYARGEPKKLPALARELLRHHPDLMVTAGTNATVAAMKETASVPIVFAGAGDPVGNGLVESLERPGGNATGTSLPASEILERSFALLRELSPKSKSYAYVADLSNKGSMRRFQALQEEGRKLGLSFRLFDGRGAKTLEQSFAAIRQERVDALLVGVSAVMLEHRNRIVQFAERERLPAVYGRREYVDAGGLASCGGNFQLLYLRSAELAQRILDGAKPAALPVTEVGGTHIVLNMKTAHALGLTVPQAVRLRAEELIE